MEQIILVYSHPTKKNVTAIMVRSPDDDTDFFDIVTGVRQRYTLASFLFIICPDQVLRTPIDLIQENSIALKKKKKKKKKPRSRYPSETITDADYTDHQANILSHTIFSNHIK